jgi:hypothetical protein
MAEQVKHDCYRCGAPQSGVAALAIRFLPHGGMSSGDVNLCTSCARGVLAYLDERKVPEVDEQVRAVVEAVRAMQAAHARLGTGDDPDEEAAFVSFYEAAVERALTVDVPEVGP